MKKIFIIIAVLAVLFTATSCGTGLHNGTQMAIGSIEVTGLPKSMEGKTVEFMGFWDGGTAAAAKESQKITDGKVTLEFDPPTIQSAPTLAFKIKPIAADGDWAWAIGTSLRLGGEDVGNIQVANTWTGPVDVKKIVGVVQEDNSVKWTVE